MSSHAIPDLRIYYINKLLDAEALDAGYVCSQMAPLLRQFASESNVGDFEDMVRFATTGKHKSLDWRNCTTHKERLAKANLSDPDTVFNALSKEGENWFKEQREIQIEEECLVDGMVDASGSVHVTQFHQRPAEDVALLRQSLGFTTELSAAPRGQAQNRIATVSVAPQGEPRETRDPRMTFSQYLDASLAALSNSTRLSLPIASGLATRPSFSQTSTQSQSIRLSAPQSMLQPPPHNRPLSQPEPQPQRQSMSQSPSQSTSQPQSQTTPQQSSRSVTLPPLPSIPQSTSPETTLPKRPRPSVLGWVPHILHNSPRCPSDSMLHSRPSDRDSAGVNMGGVYEASSIVNCIAEHGQVQQQDLANTKMASDATNEGQTLQDFQSIYTLSRNNQQASKLVPFNPPHYRKTSEFRAPVARMVSLADAEGQSSLSQTTVKRGGQLASNFPSIAEATDATRDSEIPALDPYAAFAREIQRINAQTPFELKSVQEQVRSPVQSRPTPSVRPAPTPSILAVPLSPIQCQERNRSNSYQELNTERPRLQREEAERRYQCELSEWKTQQAAFEKTRQEQAKREARLKHEFQTEIREGNDVLAYRYREYIEVYPAGPHERLSGYYLKLLANTLIEEDDLSEAAAAVRYAKEQWFNYWTIKDQDMVVALMKERRQAAVTREEVLRRDLASGGHLMTEGDVKGIRDAIGTYPTPVELP